MHELNFLEFAGVMFIGTVGLLFIFLAVEIGKEIFKKENDDDRS